MAWAPPILKMVLTPAARAAHRMAGATWPSLPGGVAITTCSTPARMGGMAFISTEEG